MTNNEKRAKRAGWVEVGDGMMRHNAYVVEVREVGAFLKLPDGAWYGPFSGDTALDLALDAWGVPPWVEPEPVPEPEPTPAPVAPAATLDDVLAEMRLQTALLTRIADKIERGER